MQKKNPSLTQMQARSQIRPFVPRLVCAQLHILLRLLHSLYKLSQNYVSNLQTCSCFNALIMFQVQSSHTARQALEKLSPWKVFDLSLNYVVSYPTHLLMFLGILQNLQVTPASWQVTIIFSKGFLVPIYVILAAAILVVVILDSRSCYIVCKRCCISLLSFFKPPEPLCIPSKFLIVCLDTLNYV